MEKNAEKPTESMISAMKAKGYNYAILIEGERYYLFIKNAETAAQVMREDFPRSRILDTMKLS